LIESEDIKEKRCFFIIFKLDPIPQTGDIDIDRPIVEQTYMFYGEKKEEFKEVIETEATLLESWKME